MGCTVRIICGVVYGDRLTGGYLGTDLGIGRERTMEASEIEPGPWHMGGQALHELERGHNDVGGAVPVGAFQLQHDIAGAVEFEPFIGDGRTCDVAAQLFELVTLIHSAAHRGVEAEPLWIDSLLLSILRIKAGNRLHGQHLLTRAGSECNAVGAGCRLQQRQCSIHIDLGHVSHPLLFNQITSARE